MTEITVQVDFVEALDRLRIETLRSIRRGAFGLAGADHVLALPTSIDGPLRFLVPELGGDLSGVRSEYQGWVIGNVLRECVDEVSAFTTSSCALCELVTLPPDTSFPGERLTKIQEDSEKRDLSPLTARLDRLARFGVTSPLADAINSLNIARSCLVHRRGIVGVRDAKSVGELVVHGVARHLAVRRYGGKEKEEPLATGITLEGGDEIISDYKRWERRFPLGTRVEFATADLINIFFTLERFGQQIVSGVHEYAKRCGNAPNEVPTPGGVPLELIVRRKASEEEK